MSFKKIAVCLPSYNESDNISSITKIIDEALVKYNKNNIYDMCIVNIDSASEDDTVLKFNSTITTVKKVSIVNDKKGKGLNLLSFFKYCEDTNIDYGLTIDSDLLSITCDWVTKILDKLIIEKKDYVVPIYERSRYEGSTTNHYAFPLVYATTGYLIRQPIAGDFGFNSRFIKLINKYDYTESTTRYGIDIYMTLIACINNLNISEVVLDKKIHSPSFNKMEEMFIDVLDSSLYVLKNIKYKFMNINNDFIKVNILKSRKFKHKEAAREILGRYKVDNINIEEEWIKIMKKIINNPSSIEKSDYNYIRKIFINRAINFWFKAQYINSSTCEEIIMKQCMDIQI